MIKLVTLAPNMEGSEEFIRELHNEVVISIGHTAADYGCAAEAMKEGALHVTHLYNAMNPMGHREPGVIGAAADNQDCMVELIGDGIHIHLPELPFCLSWSLPVRPVHTVRSPYLLPSWSH